VGKPGKGRVGKTRRGFNAEDAEEGGNSKGSKSAKGDGREDGTQRNQRRDEERGEEGDGEWGVKKGWPRGLI